MKKILIILSVLLLLPFSAIGIQAASASVSQNKSQVYPGETVTFTIKTPGADDGLQGNISISGPGTLSTSVFVFYEGGSTTFTVKANSVGTIKVNVSGKGETWAGDPLSLNTSLTIKVVSKPTTPTTPTNPTTPTTPTKPTTPSTPNKTPEQIAKEKEEAEKAEKEKASKTPLIGEVKLFSDSVKMYNEVLNVVVPEFDKWDYGFTLPKRINKVFLNVTPLDSNTVVTFDEKLDFSELGANEHIFEIRAKLGDIEQVIKYKVTMDTTEAPKIEYSGSSFTSFDDEILDNFLVDTAKFKKLTFKNAQEVEVPYYQMGSLNLIPVIDENNKAKWFVLDENFTVTRSVIVLFDKANRPFFIFDAPDDLKIKTIQGVAYQDASLSIPEILNSIDDNITWDNSVKSWKLESGSILYGMDDTGKEGNFYLDDQGNISFAVVTYDTEASVDYKTWAYAATAASAVLLISFASYVIVNLRHKRNKI